MRHPHHVISRPRALPELSCAFVGRGLTMVAVLAIALLGGPANAQSIQVFPPDVNLRTSRDMQLIAVNITEESGITRDVTDQATFTLDDPAVARLEGRCLRPLADGSTTLRVHYALHSVGVPVRVSGAKAIRPISFKLDVMPVFLNAGCNTGACHGAARGKDGFRLSLFGYDPDGDYYRLTREFPGRRLNLSVPKDSLLLAKATGKVAHTGGKRFGDDSPNYRTLLEWLDAGAPRDPPQVARPVALELFPTEMVLEGEGATQQLSARARYSDGTGRDVTALAVYMSNSDNSATVGPGGLVRAGKRGEAFIQARFDVFNVGAGVIVLPAGSRMPTAPYPASNYIDACVNQKLRKLRIAPSPLCSDEVFIRRAYIDVIGLLPTPAEMEAFVASTDPAKRERKIDELLSRKEFVDLWVMKWAELLQIRSNQDRVSYKAALQYYSLLEARIAANVPFDRIARELISSSGGTFANPAANYYQVETDTLKLAENTAQTFMGMRIQCAQCHNHPFDRWTMNDYYGFASFFAQVGRKRGEDPRETIIYNSGVGEVRHPVTMAPVPAKFLGGPVAQLAGGDRREALAAWLASPENPYFARNLANIVWAHFFGRGIIEPVDDVRISNPPANPELLDALAQRFTGYKYDFRRLVRDICTSRTYQLASEPTADNESDVRNFSHSAVRRMRAEVLLDCINQVTETQDKFRGLPRGARAVEIADGQTTNYFLTTFGRATRETVCSCAVAMEPNLSQALHLLNGETVNRKVVEGGVVRRLLATKKTSSEIVAELYLRAYSRRPTTSEMRKIEPLVNGDASRQPKALEDLFWALLNSQEFVFNH